MKSIIKLIIKIFNCVIIAVATVATIFLFASPSLSFNSRIDLDVAKFSQFIPKIELTKDIELEDALGTETFSLKIQFKLTPTGVTKAMKGERETINEMVIDNNVDGILEELGEPVSLLTDYSIRYAVKKTIKSETTKYIGEAIQSFKSKYPQVEDYTAEEIMAEANINEAYFQEFADSLYDTSNADNATLTSVNEVLFDQVGKAIAKAKKATPYIDDSAFTDAKKDEIKSSLSNIYGSLNLVKEDGEHIEKMNQIAYIYLSNYLKDQLTGKEGVKAENLVQKSGETKKEYSDRLVGEFVDTQIPDVVYQVISYVSIGLFVGLFIFTLTWVGLILITVLRTFFSKKTWTFFGPWFWIIGLLQLVLGLGLTIAGKIILPKYLDISKFNLPVSDIRIAPRTYALVPSILFLVCIVLAIAYLVLKILFKKKLKEDDSKEREAA